MMNKQEALKKIEKLEGLTIKDKDFNFDIEMIPKGEALEIVNQLDEPDKPVVPQFVADFYEENKDDLEYNLYKLCIDFHEKKLRADLYGWFNDDNHKCIETLVKMKLFGYEIEKEKLYTAMLKNSGEYLRLNWNGNFCHFKVNRKYVLDGARGYQFTEDDLVKYHIWGNDNYEVKEGEE